MKNEYWLPAVVFLGVSIPLLLLLTHMDWLGEYRLWAALGAGVLATTVVRSHMQARMQSGMHSRMHSQTQARMQSRMQSRGEKQ